MTDHWPKPRAFPGDGLKVEAEVVGGTPAKPRSIRKRLLVDRSTTYTAFSAHDLLEATSHGLHGRPGHEF